MDHSLRKIVRSHPRKSTDSALPRVRNQQVVRSIRIAGSTFFGIRVKAIHQAPDRQRVWFPFAHLAAKRFVLCAGVLVLYCGMAPRAPTRASADHDHLVRTCQRLTKLVDRLSGDLEKVRTEQHIQLTRIAQLQAELDAVKGAHTKKLPLVADRRSVPRSA